MQPATSNQQEETSTLTEAATENQVNSAPKQLHRPLWFMVTGLFVVAVGFVILLAVVIIRGPYPAYGDPQSRQFSSYTAQVFNTWVQTENSAGRSKSIVFTDYVDDKAQSENDKLAQQVITVIDGLVAEKDLVDAYKKKLTASIVEEGALFNNTNSVVLCDNLSDSRAVSVDPLGVPRAFAVYDFSFSCPAEGRQPSIRAIGRLVVSDDGSAVINVIAATDAVFNKNATQFNSAVTKLHKEG